MKSGEIREAFFRYFRERDHRVVPSSSLVPEGDPTLLFTNAGMVQFKRVFLGEEERSYRRAVTSQKCLRVSGKHNDLETVGRTARHHTFFEMLGNFSFGDYFKEEAIRYAWELLTGEFGLPAGRLWATVYRDDDDAYDLWRTVAGLPESRVVRLGEKDNFWAMGDTGPCGPCSEMVIDRGEEFRCGASHCGIGDCDCDRWLELWNLVFMQYDRDETGRMTPLPKPSIDTGMGLERISSILQGTPTNFETDLLKSIIDEVEVLSAKQYGPGPEGFPFRVIADHARACTFLISDGVMPSNEGRGYVLRRILRRAVRLGKRLDIEGPFLHSLVEVVAEEMGDAYPQIRRDRALADRVILGEETRFLETLSDGLKVAGEIVRESIQEGKGMIPGAKAFLLYDTFGFPLDLTEDLAEEHGLRVDRLGFDRSMNEQRERARAARTVTAGRSDGEIEGLPPTVFVGYEMLKSVAKVLAVFGDSGTQEEGITLVLDTTPFYPEGGGQVSDSGCIKCSRGVFEVTRVTRSSGGVVLHQGAVRSGRMCPGDSVEAIVDPGPRLSTARNHTATHLVHQGLKHILGDHVNQAGSLVDSDRLRFDFTHFEPMCTGDLARLEGIVNEWVLEDLPVIAEEMAMDGAESKGAIALFGEKYGERVRVVSIGGVSLELCGGTHVGRTGQIGLVKILGESSVGAGTRRLEAVTGLGVLDLLRRHEEVMAEVTGVLKSEPDEVPNKVKELHRRLRLVETQLEAVESRQRRKEAEALLESAIQIGKARVVSGVVDASSMEALRQVGDHLRNKIGSGVVLLGARVGEKAGLVAMVTPDLKAQVPAGAVIKAAACKVGGSGGGRADMAQAGGREPERLGEALSEGINAVRAALKGE